MSKKPSPIPYQVVVAWSAVDQAYEARVPALRHCLAYGDTPEQAVKEAKIAAGLWIKAATTAGKPLPKASATLERLSGIADVVKLSAVATLAGMSPQTLASKIKRGTPLTEDEEHRLGSVLLAYGLPV